MWERTCDMENNGVRINKFLSEAGVCSRREADRQVEAGNVLIDGRVAATGDKVCPGQKVYYNGKEVTTEEEMILIAFNKPVGIVCTAEKREKNNVIDYINYPKRIYPIGRLDKDSKGLLLLTNNGDIVNKMMRAGNKHEKEYIVTTRQKFNNDFLIKMAKGVPITNRATGKKIITAPCKTEALEDNSFKITIIQGLNRQIRRMCGYFDIDVVSLKRVRIMNIILGNMRPGELKELSQSELIKLRRMLEKV